MTRARVWLRVSTDKQDEENQAEACRRRCAYGDAGVPWVFELGADTYRTRVSGSGPEFDGDPERRRCLDDARAGRFDVLVVWALDRWTRGGILALLADVEVFKRAGVRVVSVHEPWCENELLLAIAAWQGQQEKLRRRERTQAAVDRQRAALKAQGGFYARSRAGAPPRWVTRFGRPPAAISGPAVVRALALRVAGFSWADAAAHLRREGLGDHNPRTLQRRCDGEVGPASGPVAGMDKKVTENGNRGAA